MKTRKTFIFTCLLFMASTSGIAQVSFSHSLGASYYFCPVAEGLGLMYSPRLNLASLGGESSFSIGTHLGLGLSFSSQSGGEGGSSSSYTLDLPIVLELNFGQASQPGASSMFGGFFGVGYGYSSIGSSDSWGGISSNKTSGPLFNGGIRFDIANRPLGIRASYLKSLDKDAKDVIGVGISYNFGSNSKSGFKGRSGYKSKHKSKSKHRNTYKRR
jgi:hypothetical protein